MLILREGLLEEDSTYKYIDKTDREREKTKNINGKKVEKGQSRRQISGHACIVDRLKRKFFSKGDFILLSKVLYTTMLHLPPLRFHCVGNRTQDCYDFGVGKSNTLTL
jgi:hypothetical protein